MTQETKTHPPRTSLSSLCDALQDTLSTPLMSDDILQRQAQILNQLLHITMQDVLTTAELRNAPVSTRESQIALGLRIQKQCADTLRTAAAIDYMNAITPVPVQGLPQGKLPIYDGTAKRLPLQNTSAITSTPPTPIKIRERTEENP